MCLSSLSSLPEACGKTVRRVRAIGMDERRRIGKDCEPMTKYRMRAARRATHMVAKHAYWGQFGLRLDLDCLGAEGGMASSWRVPSSLAVGVKRRRCGGGCLDGKSEGGMMSVLYVGPAYG